MYIVVSDYTNEKADVYKSVSIDKAFKSRDDADCFCRCQLSVLSQWDA